MEKFPFISFRARLSFPSRSPILHLHLLPLYLQSSGSIAPILLEYCLYMLHIVLPNTILDFTHKVYSEHTTLLAAIYQQCVHHRPLLGIG